MPARTLITAGELAARLDEPRLRIFDCRFDLARPAWGRESWREGHLPGAIHADLNTELSAAVTARSGRHPLPAPAEFEARLRGWGVDPDSRVVAYDDGNGMYAARLWWMLRWLGHEDVAVLEGGLGHWRQLGLPLTTAVPARREGRFVARLRPSLAASTDEVAAAGRDPDARLLDARAAERYRGEIEPIDRVAGHVPGARNHPFGLSLDPQGRWLPPAALRQSLAASLDGVAPERTIAYCGSGVTACHLLLALEHAGLAGARLYPGSWSEWSSDPARPVATGADREPGP